MLTTSSQQFLPILRRCILVFLTSFLFCAPSFGQWTWLNPRPGGNNCSKISFTDEQNGLLFNSNGDLFATTDQGESWNLKRNFPNTIALDVKDSIAAITGYGGQFYISKDNGNTWQAKSLGTMEYYDFVDVVSSDTIFLAQKNGRILRTHDGGNTWQALTCGIHISSIEFIDAKVGYAGGSYSYILKTTDGGATWQQNVVTNISPSNTLTIKFFDNITGFAFREHSDLLRTTDGGVTWVKYDMGDDIYAFHFISKTIGFAAGDHGVLYRTNDGGRTWNWMSPDARIYAYNLNSIYFLNSSIGFAVGARGRILKTTDGGATWKTFAPTYIDVSDLALPTQNVFYATVANKIYKTEDAGENWKPLTLTVGTNYAEYDLFEKAHFFSADTGFVTASEQARIYKTYDGGVTWKQMYVTQYGYDHVTDLQFLNNNTGFLNIYTYSQGIIVKTNDRGETWKPVWQAKYQGEFFQKIFFLDEKNGYASRYDKLYQTTDSAQTWKELWQDEDISAIWFTSPLTGFVCGENGMLRRTSDSGKTWTRIPITSQFYDDIYNIRFINQQVGYLTAENGAIYKTTDNGLTWKPWGKSSFYTLRTIQFGADSSIYLAGQYGSILRSDPREYQIGSLQASTSAHCSADLQTTVMAVLSKADSLTFEYGTNGFDQVVAATPSSVINTQQQVKATITNLLPDTTYKVRIKLFYNGSYRYSNVYYFRTMGRPATPTISVVEDSIFCEGDSAVLRSSVTIGNQWFLNGTALGNATGQTYTAKQSGLYQVVQTVGCSVSDTASVSVVVVPRPSTPVVTISDSLLMSSFGSGNQWFLNGTLILGAHASTYRPLTDGIYAVQVTQNGCQSPLSDPIKYEIPEETGQAPSIGPNPVTNGQLNIRFSGSSVMYTVSLMDSWGRLVYRSRFSKETVIYMRPFTAGVYLVHIWNERTKEEVKRIIIKN